MLRDLSVDEARGPSERPRPTATWHSWLAVQSDPHLLLSFFLISQVLDIYYLSIKEEAALGLEEIPEAV